MHPTIKNKKEKRKKKTGNVLQPKEPGLLTQSFLLEIDSSSSKQVRISTNGLTITLLKARKSVYMCKDKKKKIKISLSIYSSALIITFIAIPSNRQQQKH
jgi:hypothetical protein